MEDAENIAEKKDKERRELSTDLTARRSRNQTDVAAKERKELKEE